MDQAKIGEFIAKCRKDKNMTQSELAFKLGVSDRTIGNWERGRNMPDISLFKPLCDILEITINELLTGQKITSNKNENNDTIKLIDYCTNNIKKINRKIYKYLIVISIGLLLSGIYVFKIQSFFGILYIIIGLCILIPSIYKLDNKIFLKVLKKIIKFSNDILNLIHEYKRNIYRCLFLIGIGLIIIGFSIVPPDIFYGQIYIIIGAFLSFISLVKLNNVNNIIKRISINIMFILIIITLTLLTDYIIFSKTHTIPRFYNIKNTINYNDNNYYDTLFKDVIICKDNKYKIINNKKMNSQLLYEYCKLNNN